MNLDYFVVLFKFSWCLVTFQLLTIQKRVPVAKSAYCSIVDRTLKIRHTRTRRKLQRENTAFPISQLPHILYQSSSGVKCRNDLIKAGVRVKIKTEGGVKGYTGEIKILPFTQVRLFFSCYNIPLFIYSFMDSFKIVNEAHEELCFIFSDPSGLREILHRSQLFFHHLSNNPWNTSFKCFYMTYDECLRAVT